MQLRPASRTFRGALAGAGIPELQVDMAVNALLEDLLERGGRAVAVMLPLSCEGVRG